MLDRVALTRARPGVLAYLACIRYREVLVLQGSPLLGVAFTVGPLTPSKAATALLLALASFLLVAHIFSFNDWAGIASDSRDPNKSADVFLTRGLSRQDVLGLSFALLGGSLLLFVFLPRRTLLLAVAIALLGLLYSHPATNAKATPIVSSAPHLAGGVLHFLLGYSVFGGLDRRGLLIALFFALTFTAGHLNQEVRDHDGDRLNRLSTNAVRFGTRAAFLAGLALFTLAYADLLLLAGSGVVPAVLGWLPVALYPLHLGWSVAALRAGLTYETMIRFQRRYRTLYAVIGALMLVTLLVL
jgi:4-hydroxybenzoate polyprenyltransferase